MLGSLSRDSKSLCQRSAQECVCVKSLLSQPLYEAGTFSDCLDLTGFYECTMKEIILASQYWCSVEYPLSPSLSFGYFRYFFLSASHFVMDSTTWETSRFLSFGTGSGNPEALEIRLYIRQSRYPLVTSKISCWQSA